MMFKNGYWIALVVVIIAGCGKSGQTTGYTTQTCTFTAPTTVAPATEIAYLQNYLSSRSIVATKDSSGLFYKIDSVGSGTTVPTVCSVINFSYVGNLLSTDNSNAQFDAGTISYYLGSLITGWQIGIPYIKKGGSITLYIPPSLAYGSTAQVGSDGTVKIPANSYLKFSIQLLNIQ